MWPRGLLFYSLVHISQNLSYSIRLGQKQNKIGVLEVMQNRSVFSDLKAYNYPITCLQLFNQFHLGSNYLFHQEEYVYHLTTLSFP